MNVNQFLVTANKSISSWLKNPGVQRAVAITMGFVWGMLVGVIVTLLIVVGV
ncbi:hypothetical protein LCGC14_1175590 [marine sediment metagenome]|uniref:Uncharacterized protein n=1 Tax=marine sediment metagenome TaxID=412755 RepID=A0A0F9LNM1_9ZZZZ